MRLRPAAQTDTEIIARVHRASIEGLCREAYSAEDIAGWTALLEPEIYDNAIQEKIMLVAEDGGEIRGMGILDLKDGEVHAVYVHPDAAGQGLGQKILAELEKRALGNGVERLILSSTLNAVGFYKKHGYREEGRTVYQLSNGVKLDCVRMHKILINPDRQDSEFPNDQD